MQKLRSLSINSFTLKIIAIIGMTADHIGNAFMYQLPFVARCLLFLPGGLTFPIMAFLLTVGYQHTRDVGKYALRLAIFAAISVFPFFWVLSNEFRLNVLFTLLLGLLVIWADDRLKNRILFWGIVVLAIVASHWCDWSYIGVPMILLYHRLRNRGMRAFLPIVLVWIYALSNVVQILGMQMDPSISSVVVSRVWSFYTPQLFYSFIGATATIFLVYFYNGERGRPLKYFFYAYYPLHITLIGVVFGLVTSNWIPGWLPWITGG
ncbi:MAG: conjugal transfer protein TraX [Coriobacteriales bacterium]|jgi:hypothetical protein|nr:conjugal transfer protein TraX [Coriobacteriales bacterium]